MVWLSAGCEARGFGGGVFLMTRMADYGAKPCVSRIVKGTGVLKSASSVDPRLGASMIEMRSLLLYCRC